jgi:hypothetical protein
MKDQLLQAGTAYRIPVYLPELNDVEGYQYTLEFDQNEVSLLDVEPGLAQSVHFGKRYAAEGMLTTSWHRSGTIPETVSSDSLARMFTLVLSAGKEVWLSDVLRLSSRITTAESYNRVGEIKAVGLAFEKPVAIATSPILNQNYPNPFAEQTRIGYELPESTRIRFTVFDVRGRQLYMEEGWRDAGKHQVQLNLPQLKQAGIYYYTLMTEEGFRKTRKMVVQ